MNLNIVCQMVIFEKQEDVKRTVEEYEALIKMKRKNLDEKLKNIKKIHNSLKHLYGDGICEGAYISELHARDLIDEIVPTHKEEVKKRRKHKDYSQRLFTYG